MKSYYYDCSTDILMYFRYYDNECGIKFYINNERLKTFATVWDIDKLRKENGLSVYEKAMLTMANR